MAHNLISVCHKCKVQIFHFRNEEHKTIMAFHLEHKQCINQSLTHVQTFLDNTDSAPKCINSEESGGYKELK